mmetsp:Transcript_14286/g.30418  ORF Transcript_14286/g.30418 Transcript_14286/m.30418 type:complete len:286 (-) Transcript_14286:273-1130(-)
MHAAIHRRVGRIGKGGGHANGSALLSRMGRGDHRHGRPRHQFHCQDVVVFFGEGAAEEETTKILIVVVVVDTLDGDCRRRVPPPRIVIAPQLRRRVHANVPFHAKSQRRMLPRHPRPLRRPRPHRFHTLRRHLQFRLLSQNTAPLREKLSKADGKGHRVVGQTDQAGRLRRRRVLQHPSRRRDVPRAESPLHQKGTAGRNLRLGTGLDGRGAGGDRRRHGGTPPGPGRGVLAVHLRPGPHPHAGEVGVDAESPRRAVLYRDGRRGGGGVGEDASQFGRAGYSRVQ